LVWFFDYWYYFFVGSNILFYDAARRRDAWWVDLLFFCSWFVKSERYYWVQTNFLLVFIFAVLCEILAFFALLSIAKCAKREPHKEYAERRHAKGRKGLLTFEINSYIPNPRGVPTARY
jgi:hypothetical protein